MELYLIYPENQAYVEGRADKPASIQPPNWGSSFISISVMLMFFLIPMSLGLWTVVSDLRADALLTEGSITTQGRVINRYTSEDSEGDTLYHVVFEYVANDRRLSHEQQVSEEAYTRYEQGVALDIEYARADPNIARLVGTRSYPLGSFIGLFFALLLMLPLPVAYATVRLIAGGLKRRAFLRKGQKLKGKLLSLDVEEAVDSEGDKYTATIVRVAFRAPDGRVVHGERRYDTARGRQQPPPAEAAVAIFYKDDQEWEVL
jgi:hypothetical protein